MQLRHAAAVLALGLVAVCSPAVRLRAQSAPDLFASQDLQRIDLYVHSADWSRLKEDYLSNTYYPADVSWNGTTVRNVGIRSRGKASRNGSKPGLKLDFNHYASGQTFLGLKSLVLDNFGQDPSGIRETSAMWFMARMSLPAPREVHVVVYVNGDYAGVYAAVESVDKTMLTRLYGGDENGNDGYLYEFSKVFEWGFTYLGPDLDAYRAFFPPRTHENGSDETLYRPIETLVRLINEKPSDELVAAVGPLLDLSGLVRYVALQNFVSEIDGFTGRWGTNNFYLYRPTGGTQHVFIPWDDDLTFIDTDYGETSYQDSNVLMRKLMEIPEYRALYISTLQQAAQSANEGFGAEPIGALEREIRRQIDLIDSAMLLDPARPWTTREYEDARDYIKHFAPRRIRYVECAVARMTGARPCD